MEITGINSYELAYEMDAPFEPSWYPGFEQIVHRVQLYELETDADIRGITSVTGDATRIDSLDLAREYLVGKTLATSRNCSTTSHR